MRGLAEGIDVDVPPGRFEVTLGSDDLPSRLQLTVDGADAHDTESIGSASMALSTSPSGTAVGASAWTVGCASASASYTPPPTDEAAMEEWYSSIDHLDVYLLPHSCALEYDDTPFEPGEFGDLPSREDFGFVEVLVGDTVVQFDTTYTDDLPAMVASIQPFDLDAELARVASLAEESWIAMGP